VAEGERLFREIARQYPKSDTEPEAVYWARVSKDKAALDGSALAGSAREWSERYPESSGPNKALV